MLDRFEPVLKVICLVLAALLLLQIGRRVAHPDPLGSASIPPMPTLSTIGTNTPPAKEKLVKDTNTNAITNANTLATTNATTNAPSLMAKTKAPKHGPHFGGGPAAGGDLPVSIQARVDKIKESEILGPFMRPPPMALLGIADDNAFLRAPDGQSGMVKEGDELGGVKLLRIGTNRVLVEENGEKKELTLFEGYGGESLLPKEPENSTNGTNMPKQKDNP